MSNLWLGMSCRLTGYDLLKMFRERLNSVSVYVIMITTFSPVQTLQGKYHWRSKAGWWNNRPQLLLFLSFSGRMENTTMSYRILNLINNQSCQTTFPDCPEKNVEYENNYDITWVGMATQINILTQGEILSLIFSATLSLYPDLEHSDRIATLYLINWRNPFSKQSCNALPP